MDPAALSPATAPAPAARGQVWLERSVKAWFVATAIGQLAFAAFIVLFYYTSTLSGQFASWNSKPLITGYVAGDQAGNLGFAAHVLLAGVMTLCGLIQLIPAVRRRWPALHRASGRTFLLTALLLSLGGLALVWLRGSYMTMAGAIAITMDGLLILWFAAMAWRSARARQIARHRRWALRLFMVASGVWMMRVGYMAWAVATGGLGIAKGMSGPFDLFWAFATHLLPLLVLELYLQAERSPDQRPKAVMAGVLSLAALVILAGSLGAWFLMWSPYF